jgi:hypothetical protein
MKVSGIDLVKRRMTKERERQAGSALVNKMGLYVLRT